jgi:hypothetical protein
MTQLSRLAFTLPLSSVSVRTGTLLVTGNGFSTGRGVSATRGPYP